MCYTLLHQSGSYTGEPRGQGGKPGTGKGSQAQVFVGSKQVVCMRFESLQQCHYTDIPTPVGVRAKVTADNTIKYQSVMGVVTLDYNHTSEQYQHHRLISWHVYILKPCGSSRLALIKYNYLLIHFNFF